MVLLVGHAHEILAVSDIPPAVWLIGLGLVIFLISRRRRRDRSGPVGGQWVFVPLQGVAAGKKKPGLLGWVFLAVFGVVVFLVLAHLSDIMNAHRP